MNTCDFGPGNLLRAVAGPEDRKDDADAIVPLPRQIKILSDVTLNLGTEAKPQHLVVSVPYSVQGDSTIIPLPVWALLRDVEINSGGPKAEFARCDYGALLAEKSEGGLLLKVPLVNLLRTEKHRKVIEDRLRADVAQSLLVKPETLRIVPSTINETSYRATLCASGGDVPEVELTEPMTLPKTTVQGDEPATFRVLSQRVAYLKSIKEDPTRLGDLYVKIEGSLKVRMEKKDYDAQFTAVRKGVTALQSRASSIAPSAKRPVDTLVYLPDPGDGGAAQQSLSAESVLMQQLTATINVREGASLDRGVVESLAGKLLDHLLDNQIKLAEMERDQRIAVMVGNQATLASTVGEITDLAKKSRKEREEALNAALSEAEARRNKSDVKHSGSLGVEYGTQTMGFAGVVGGAVAANVKGKLDLATQKVLEVEEAKQRSEAMKTFQRGLDDLERHFSGKLPTLSGIRFDQKTVAGSFDRVEATLQKNVFTTGWIPYEWPIVTFRKRIVDAEMAGKLEAQLEVAREQIRQFDEHLARLKMVEERLAQLDRREAELRRLSAVVEQIEKAGPAAKELSRLAGAIKDQSALEAISAEVARLEARIKDYDRERNSERSRPMQIVVANDH